MERQKNRAVTAWRGAESGLFAFCNNINFMEIEAINISSNYLIDFPASRKIVKAGVLMENIGEAITSIVAILNKHGSGELYFGVRNNGDVLGQVINDETLRKVSQAIKNHITPSIFPEITIKTFEDGKQTVYVKFSGNQQPYLAHNVARIRQADEDLVY